MFPPPQTLFWTMIPKRWAVPSSIFTCHRCCCQVLGKCTAGSDCDFEETSSTLESEIRRQWEWTMTCNETYSKVVLFPVMISGAPGFRSTTCILIVVLILYIGFAKKIGNAFPRLSRHHHASHPVRLAVCRFLNWGVIVPFSNEWTKPWFLNVFHIASGMHFQVLTSFRSFYLNVPQWTYHPPMPPKAAPVASGSSRWFPAIETGRGNKPQW